jgi:hypothetical protein
MMMMMMDTKNYENYLGELLHDQGERVVLPKFSNLRNKPTIVSIRVSIWHGFSLKIIYHMCKLVIV